MSGNKQSQTSIWNTNTKTRTTAELNDLNLYRYAYGYKEAGEILCKHIKKNSSDKHVLVFPIIFIYRHAIETVLKDIITDSDKILNTKKKTIGHDIKRLWIIAKDNAEKATGFLVEPNYAKEIDAVITEITCVDAKADAFRYPTDNKNNPNLNNLNAIDIVVFYNAVTIVLDKLHAISAVLGDLSSL